MAMQATVELAEGQEREVAFIFGSGRDVADARVLVGRYRGTGAARGALEEVWGYWNRTLGAVHVQTAGCNIELSGQRMAGLPDPVLPDVGAQRHLPVGRRVRLPRPATGRHVAHPCQTGPTILREQLMLVAPPTSLRKAMCSTGGTRPVGRGVRTKCSDDYLWLPYAVCRYVNAIGDTGILDERHRS
jgi:cyclic beta-1,2-glucan synthetase